MKRSVIILLVIINSLSTALVAQDTAADKFKSGVEQYTAGNFEAAVDTWMKLYNEGYRSADLLYNIGNVNYKLKNIPGSILFYERALLLKPGSEDIRYNLQIARQSVVDKFTGIPDVFFVEWYNFASLSLRSDAWALVSITSFILLLFILAFFFFTSAYRIKVIAFWVAVLWQFSAFRPSRSRHVTSIW
ncbi:MAG: tetratricopeptide repeat protein [Bacteroidales bacterium]